MFTHQRFTPPERIGAFIVALVFNALKQQPFLPLDILRVERAVFHMGVEEKLAQELHTLRYSPVPVKGETVCNGR